MALTNQEIIAEAGLLVPNEYTTADKIPWLNAVNQEFFEVVKIPETYEFPSVKDQRFYTISGTAIKEKNIDSVMVGPLKYRSRNYEDVPPKQNYFTFNESDNKLTLSVAPYANDLSGSMRAYKAATSTYTTGGVENQTPDAPAEHHWIYVLGLAELIAKALEEEESSTVKAANFGTQYRNALNVAAQGYRRAT